MSELEKKLKDIEKKHIVDQLHEYSRGNEAISHMDNKHRSYIENFYNRDFDKDANENKLSLKEAILLNEKFREKFDPEALKRDYPTRKKMLELIWSIDELDTILIPKVYDKLNDTELRYAIFRILTYFSGEQRFNLLQIRNRLSKIFPLSKFDDRLVQNVVLNTLLIHFYHLPYGNDRVHVIKKLYDIYRRWPHAIGQMSDIVKKAIPELEHESIEEYRTRNAEWRYLKKYVFNDKTFTALEANFDFILTKFTEHMINPSLEELRAGNKGFFFIQLPTLGESERNIIRKVPKIDVRRITTKSAILVFLVKYFEIYNDFPEPRLDFWQHSSFLTTIFSAFVPKPWWA